MKLQLLFGLLSFVFCVKCHRGQDKPTVTTPPLPQTVFERHGSAEFKCIAEGRGRIHYHWYKGSVHPKNEILESSRNMKISRRGTQLTIVKPTRNLAGMYYCAVSNHVGLGEPKGALLNVTYAPDNIEIIPKSELMSSIEGGSITVRCHSDSNPPARYSWFQIIKAPGRKSVNRLIRKTSLSGYLKLNRVSKKDIGEYQCMALNNPDIEKPNRVRFRKKGFRLNVQYGPYQTKFMVNEHQNMYIRVKEGEGAALSCISDSNPPAEYNITKDNMTSPLNRNSKIGSYIIKKMSASNEGVYYCSSRNKVTNRVEKKKVHLFMKGPCFKGPCKNNGVCHVTDLHHYKCECPKGFVGKNCQAAPCRKHPCQNNGTCHILNEREYKCECPVGFAGKHCNDEYRPVGCFYDNIYNRAIPDLILNIRKYIQWDHLDLTVKNCSSYAKSLGYSVFSVQFYGECWSGHNTELTYNKYGPSDYCYHGVGRNATNFVYYNVMEKTDEGTVLN